MDPIIREIQTENGDRLSITYELMEDKNCKSYGLRMREIRTSPEKTIEIPGICGNLLEIEDLIMLLSRYSVTSATVYDILEDYRTARI